MGAPASHYAISDEVFSICAGAALYRRTFFDDVGDFDETFVSYLEDIDLGLRGRLLGYRYRYVPQAEILHHGHGSGLPHARYVTLMTRNRLALLVKNIPLPLLRKHWRTLLYGQLYYFLAYKRPLHSLWGTLWFLKALPPILRQRKALQRRKKVSNAQLETMLTDELGEPSLKTLIKHKLQRTR